MPEYAFSIDIYAASTEASAARQHVPGVRAAGDRRRRESALASRGGVQRAAGGARRPRERVHVRTRRKQARCAIRKLAERGEFQVAAEGGLELLVNFTDYLDTGLFLDHRPTRARIRELAARKSFLNLFAYTGDLGVRGRRRRAHDDERRPLADVSRLGAAQPRAQRLRRRQTAPLAASGRARVARGAGARALRLDLPRPADAVAVEAHDEELDVQRDHVELIRSTLLKLAPNGLLIFSTNFRKFRLDDAALADFSVEDVSAATIPKDFARNPRIHRCFEIRVPAGVPNAAARAVVGAGIGPSGFLCGGYSRSGRNRPQIRSALHRARTSAARAAFARTRRAASAACRRRTR